MAINPKAISTGEGTGLAKVIKPMQSDYYDKKYAEAKGRKDEAKKSMAAAMSKTPWKVDMPEFQNKVAELRNFYNENAYDLMKGDFDAQVQLDAMQQGLIRFAEQSKADEKYWNLNDKLLKDKPNYYSDNSYKSHTDYAKMPLADRKEYSFREKFDADKFQKDLAADMAKIQPEQGMPFKTGDMYVQKATVDPEEVEANALEFLQAAVFKYGEEEVNQYIDSIGGVDKFLSNQKDYVKDKINWKLESKGYVNPYAKDGLTNPFNFSTDVSTVESGTPIALESGVYNPFTGEKFMGMNPTPVNVTQGLEFEDDISVTMTPSSDAIIGGGVFGYDYVDKDGERQKGYMYAKSGDKDDWAEKYKDKIGDDQVVGYDRELFKKSLSSPRKWKIAGIGVYDTFPEDTKGKQSKQDLHGMLAGAEDLKAVGKDADHRAYVTLTSKGKNIYVPVSEVIDEMRQQYKSKNLGAAFDSFINNYKAELKKKGYTNALKDFDKGSKKTPKPQEKKEEKEVSSKGQYVLPNGKIVNQSALEKKWGENWESKAAERGIKKQ